MARAEVPDTTVFIELLREPGLWQGFHQRLASGRIWLSSVVVCELYAGTRSGNEARLLDDIVAAMRRVDRLLLPTTDEWSRAGRLIARRIRLRGNLRPREHLADVLIVMTAARLAATVLTANFRHLAAWVDLANDSGLDVTITRYPS